MNLEEYWESLPIGKANRKTYNELCDLWSTNKRWVRNILHRLSEFDNGDGYVLIRSSKHSGFYKSNDREEIESYRREIISRATNTFAPLKKINRVLGEADGQITIDLV